LPQSKGRASPLLDALLAGESFFSRLFIVFLQEGKHTMSTHFHTLIDLQLHGVCGTSLEPGRRGGAGPSGLRAFMLDNHCVMLPVNAHAEAFHVAAVQKGGILLDTTESNVLLSAVPKPHFYDLKTAEGVPYRQIALLHGSDCLASTVVQQCSRYARPEHRCRFCALGESLASGATILRKTPEQLAEVAEAAQRLDGVKHVTLTSGTAVHRDAGIRYLGECARAITSRTGLPVQIQFEPPEDKHIFAELKAMGVVNVSMHVESLDEKVRRRITPGKASITLKEYFAAFAAAVAVFGRNRVNTYVILGLGEDKAVTLARCRKLVELGVYPSLVPLRSLPGTFMADAPAPDPEYLRDMYSAVGAALREAGLTSAGCAAGCGRCRACSLLQFTEEDDCMREATTGFADEAKPAPRTCALHSERQVGKGLCPPLAPVARDFPPASVSMIVASTPEELAACHAVRQAVFVEEQGIFPENDTDVHDIDAVHILALVDGEIAGVVRCYRQHGDIWYGGRLAVLRRFRSHLGALLVHKAVEVMCSRPDVRRFFAMVQIQNVRFFRRLHWKGLGHTFMYNGCKHQLMERALSREEGASCVAELPNICSTHRQPPRRPLPHYAVAASDGLFPVNQAQ
jgi:radical SAM protein (TIGR04043 family)/putative N-acetyltransferase (TIGR04045 family)